MDARSEATMGVITRAAAYLTLAIFGMQGTAESQEVPLITLENDSVSIQLIDADLRVAVQAIAVYLDKPVIFGAIGEYRVTLSTPRPVARGEMPDLLRGLLASSGLEMVEEPGHYGVAGIASAVSVEMSPAEVQLFVLRLRHARAADVAATVSALYGQAGALGELGAGPRLNLSESLRENLIPPVGAAPNQPAPVTQQVAELAGQTTIIPDQRTNSLLVRASARDFELIRAAVEQLDVRPLQVLIEVAIVEVRRDNSRSIGIEAILPRTLLSPSSDAEISGSTTGLGLGDLVLSVMHLGGVDLSVTLRAAESRGIVTILSRPVVIAANNEAAEIMVGSQRPFIQLQRSLPTDAPVRDQVVQFKEVGTRLTVVPTISDDGYVMLEVAQEVNAATAEVAFDAPVISTRSIQTQLLVKDGHTAVMGGLSDRQRERTRSGVPFLSRLPLIGIIFGKHETRTTETELFVFLTPRVIASDEQLDDLFDSVGDQTRDLKLEIPR
jgi:general secretion pathway protein D